MKFLVPLLFVSGLAMAADNQVPAQFSCNTQNFTLKSMTETAPGNVAFEGALTHITLVDHRLSGTNQVVFDKTLVAYRAPVLPRYYYVEQNSDTGESSKLVSVNPVGVDRWNVVVQTSATSSLKLKNCSVYLTQPQ